MDELFEQLANISKAHAYDIISDHQKELKEQNEIFRKGLLEVLDIISKEDINDIIAKPSQLISKIGNHCNKLLSENRPL